MRRRETLIGHGPTPIGGRARAILGVGWVESRGGGSPPDRAADAGAAPQGRRGKTSFRRCQCRLRCWPVRSVFRLCIRLMLLLRFVRSTSPDCRTGVTCQISRIQSKLCLRSYDDCHRNRHPRRAKSARLRQLAHADCRRALCSPPGRFPACRPSLSTINLPKTTAIVQCATCQASPTTSHKLLIWQDFFAHYAGRVYRCSVTKALIYITFAAPGWFTGQLRTARRPAKILI